MIQLEMSDFNQKFTELSKMVS